MACNTCGDGGGISNNNNVQGCGPYKRGQVIEQIAALKRREPWCSEGACCLMLSDHSEARRIMHALLASGLVVVREDGSLVILDAKGSIIGCYADQPSLIAALAGAGGSPNFNALTRNPRLSPTDIEAIAAGYSYEGLEGSQLVANPFEDRWYAFRWFGVGVSHRLCLLDFSLTGRVGAGGALLPFDMTLITGVAIGGTVLTCGTGAEGSQTGSWVLAYEHPVDWNREETEVTAARCRCINLCVDVPADSLDIIYVKIPLAAIPVGATEILIDASVSRCRWMCPAYPSGQVPQLSNRTIVTAASGWDEAELRPTPGALPFLS